MILNIVVSNISETNFYKYIKERNKQDIIEDEHGFIIYKISNDECYINDMFISPDWREQHRGTDLLISLKEIAKNSKCKAITASVHLWDDGHPVTLKAALNSGFKIVKASNDVLLLALFLEG